MHDLSDGFVFPGVKSQKLTFSVNAAAAQLRTNDGNAFISVFPVNDLIKIQTTANISVSAGGNLTANVGGVASVTAPTVNIVGNVNITGALTVSGNLLGGGAIQTPGTVTGGTDVVFASTSLKNHIHGGVTAGSANTTPPR
jgi:phage baseplate assembly protein gpV